MKRLTAILPLIMFCITSSAQQKFIKEIIGADYGAAIRVLPATDLGWVVFSKDSLRLTKFNGCGDIEWSKKYHVANMHSSLCDFISTKDGGYALLTRILSGNVYGSLVTKLDSLGTIIWCKSYEDLIYNHYPYTLSEDQQGNLIFFENVMGVNGTTVYNMLVKISTSGNLISTRFYNYGSIWGGAIVTSDNGILMRTGGIFIKTDNAGNVQWTANVLASTYHYLAPTEVSDGYIFTGYNNSNHAISFYKFDKQGNLLWGGRKTSDIIGTPLPLHKKNNGNLVGIFSKNTITMIIEFDKDLNVVAQSSIYNSTLFGKDLCFLSDGTPVLAGLGIMNPVFAKLDHSYHSKCDAVSDVVNFISEPASANFINNIVSTTNLNVVTKNYLTDTVAVSVVTLCNTPKVLDIGNDTLLCKGTTMILQNHNNDLFDHYQWSTGETSPAISINEPGTYWLLVNDDCNVNDLNDTVWIKIKPAVEADLGADVLLCEKAMLQFYAPVCDSCLFEWSTGSQADSIEVKEQGSYWLSVKNNNGCTSTDTVEVSIVKCECELYIPNAFTPNEDGLNELFNPVYDCDVADYTLKIINRWGELVYTSNNITAGWTGMFNNRTVLSGIYIYVITYRPLIKGKPNDRIVKRGTVAVIY